MLAENGELSFGDSGRMMGELWHKLSDDQKEDYRKRAKDVTDQKLKDWQVMTYLLTYMRVFLFVNVASVCQIGKSKHVKRHLAKTVGTLRFY